MAEDNIKKAEQEREGIFRRLGGAFMDFFRRIVGIRPEAEEAVEQRAADPKKTQAFLNAWDDLSDNGDELKQNMENTLTDLEAKKPQMPTGMKTQVWEQYRDDLEQHAKSIAMERQKFSTSAKELQGERDTLIQQSEADGIAIPNSSDLDTKLGADGITPSDALLAQAQQDTYSDLYDANDAISGLRHDQPDLATPLPPMKADGMPRGKAARMAIGERMAEIVQQAPIGSNGRPDGHQASLDKELARLMPKKDLGNMGLKDQHEQIANTQFAEQMMASLRRFSHQRSREHEAGNPAVTEGGMARQRADFMADDAINITANDITERNQYHKPHEARQVLTSAEHGTLRGYAALSVAANLESSTFEPPEMASTLEQSEVTSVTNMAQRLAITDDVRDIVQGAQARAAEEGTVASLNDEEKDKIRDLVTPLMAKDGLDVQSISPAEALNQERNSALASHILSEVGKGIEHHQPHILTDMQKGGSYMTSDPSQQEIQAFEDDPEFEYRTAAQAIREETLTAKSRMNNVLPEAPQSTQPSMTM